MIRAILLTMLLTVPAGAQTTAPAELADTQLADPTREAVAKGLMETLRCVVCQGQSIADSDATMAGDMRALVRQRIGRGESPGAVRDWLIGRYGVYITYDPPMTVVTWPLWLAPIALLAIGIVVARASFRRRGR